MVVSRTGYTGELGYEIFCHPKDALTVFDAIWQPHGLMPLGLQALDMPCIEAGIGFAVPPQSKSQDFIGREALTRRKENPQRKLFGLENGGDETIGHGDCVHVGRAQIGMITSITRSPILKKTITLARVEVTTSKIGTEVEVGKLDGHQKPSSASSVTIPRRREYVRDDLFATRLTLVGA